MKKEEQKQLFPTKEVMVGYILLQFTGLKQLVKGGLSSDVLFGTQEPGMVQI
jgi:hypothetical protein